MSLRIGQIAFVVAFFSLQAHGQGYSPTNAVSHMTVPGGLAVTLVASEPMIAQPVCIEFDDRGRLWVIQYLQYPNPAGLKRATVDRWSRTTYDRVPEPPPRGPKGADRITILEDTDDEGCADKAKDFLSGLNLASGLAFGHGGVFVLQTPHLLFYPDRNGDDVPDSDPEVLLTGFGMEDAHSVANSLTWGPDGWLYGCQGSTVTANIRGIEFQQGVWRYHPLTREFELFCEGGGNSWGLDFDDEGELIYSTNLGPYRNLHGVQGAYYWKSFGKHGALHNPYAFGYFDHIPHTNFTGGHVTDGGIIYRGTNLPPRFQGRYICGDLLGHGVQWHEMFRLGSTFTSTHGGYLLDANDNWFAATDITTSPDGAVYVADWFDQRTAHPDPDAEWDRNNGRIYRIATKGTRPIPVPDLRKLSTTQLIALLSDRNNWFVRKARRVLADRRDPAAIPPLRALVFNSPNDHTPLEAFWALYVSGGFDEAAAAKTLKHRSAPIRKWAVRLLGDAKQVSPTLGKQLVELAQHDSDVRVRAQLAAAAQRLPPENALPIIEALLTRDMDGSDPYIPLLLWWAVEKHANSALTEVQEFFTSSAAWKSRIVRETVVERLMRRWSAEGKPATFDACAALLTSAPDATQQRGLLAAIEQGFHDRPVNGIIGFGSGGLFAKTEVAELRTNNQRTSIEHVTPALAEKIASFWRDDTSDAGLIRLTAHTGNPAGLVRARALAADLKAPTELRREMIRLLGDLSDTTDAQLLLAIVDTDSEPLQLPALDALLSLGVQQIVEHLLQRYGGLSEPVRARIRAILLSRKEWARTILREVDSGRLPATDFSPEQLRVVALHQDGELNALVRKHWGRLSGGTAEEKLAEMRRLNNDLNAGTGDSARGREIFMRVCGTCHTMFGEGGKIGPDLTTANRVDREFLLASIVDPSAAIRKEFLAYEIELKNGRALSGVIVDQSAGNLTLGMTTGERVTIPESQIASLRESTVSVMPEGLVKPLKPQELRDLFTFLQSKTALARKP